MTRNVRILIFSALTLAPLSVPAVSQEATRAFGGSLFFSPQQQADLRAALALRPAQNSAISGAQDMVQIPESQPSWSISRLHLSALIFYEPQKWSLWFGDRQVRKDNLPPFLTDLKVFAHHIDVSVIPRPGAAPIPVRLRPNQTFLVDLQRIVEGGRVAN